DLLDAITDAADRLMHQIRIKAVEIVEVVTTTGNVRLPCRTESPSGRRGRSPAPARRGQRVLRRPARIGFNIDSGTVGCRRGQQPVRYAPPATGLWTLEALHRHQLANCHSNSLSLGHGSSPWLGLGLVGSWPTPGFRAEI